MRGWGTSQNIVSLVLNESIHLDISILIPKLTEDLKHGFPKYQQDTVDIQKVIKKTCVTSGLEYEESVS